MSIARCSSCGAELSGPFCSRCGAPQGTTSTRRERRAWQAATGALAVVAVLFAFMLVRRPSQPAGPLPAPVAGETGTPPDLSTMTPRERFDRLYRRVLGAAETGDTTTAARFLPMAFAAYSQLDTVDADARYHAAVLRLHVLGDTAGALRLADTILVAAPHHLLGHLIRILAGRQSGDAGLLRKGEAGLEADWSSEMKAARPEYTEHRTMLEQFHGGASATPPDKRGSGGGSGGR